MRCVYCGNTVSNIARCCPKCGGAVSNSSKISKTARRPEDEIQFSVIPSIAPGLVFLRLFPPCFLVAFFLTAVFGTILMLLLELIQFHYGIYSYYIIGAVLFYLIVVVPYVNVIKKAKASRFAFYNDRLEYTDNPSGPEIKTIEYTTILDMNMTRGLMQKAYNFGTIRIFAVGSTQDFMLVMRDIKNPDRTFRKISDLVEKR